MSLPDAMAMYSGRRTDTPSASVPVRIRLERPQRLAACRVGRRERLAVVSEEHEAGGCQRPTLQELVATGLR